MSNDNAAPQTDDTAGMSMVDFALGYARRGFHVFPVLPWPLGDGHSKGKTPAVRYKEWATRDAGKIRGWWGRNTPKTNKKHGRYVPSKCGLAVYTGKWGDSTGALLVLDVDNKGTKKGDKEILRLKQEGYALPPTLRTYTPNRGTHHIYCVDAPVRQSTSKIGDGLDIRSAGGFIVAPPSVVAGKAYSFDADSEPDPAPAPAWLIDRCGADTRKDSARPIVAAAGIDQDAAARRARRYLLDVAPIAIEGSGGNQTTYTVAAQLKDLGVSAKEVCADLMLEHWNPRCAPPWTADDLKTLVDNAYRYGRNPVGIAAPEVDFKPIADSAAQSEPGPAPLIRFKPEQLISAADAAEAAMLADTAAEPVLGHGGQYATVRRAKAATAREMVRGNSGAAIFHYDAPALRERVMKSARFSVYRKNAWTPDKAPEDLISTLLSRGGGNAPGLTGLLRAPTICPDGRMIAEPGYDRPSGLFAVFSADSFSAARSIGAATQHDARASYTWLEKELFGEFSFRDRVDESAAIAGLLTGVVRPVCGLAPAFALSSAVQGSGKTTLAEVIGISVEGAAPGLNSWPEADAELEKIIFSALLAGHTSIVFDNIRSGAAVRSDKLAKLLTTETTQGRVLGQSRLAGLPTAVLVMLTGNNIALEGDIPSRVIEVYLDSQLERPDRRTFARDIRQWASDNRSDTVAKALTIIKAYLDAGAPKTGGATRFPDWDRMVRRAVVWAGGEDISAKFDRAYEDDPQIALLRDVVRLWQPAFGDAPLAAGEIVAKVEAADFNTSVGAFREALQGLLCDRHTPRLDAKVLGVRIKRHANRPVDGLRISSVYNAHRKQHLWFVAPVKARDKAA